MSFTLSDMICAPLAGLTENDKLELIRNSSTAKEIPKVDLYLNLDMGLYNILFAITLYPKFSRSTSSKFQL